MDLSRLKQLCERWCDDALTSEDARELNHLLTGSLQARLYFRSYVEMHGDLSMHGQLLTAPHHEAASSGSLSISQSGCRVCSCKERKSRKLAWVARAESAAMGFTVGIAATIYLKLEDTFNREKNPAVESLLVKNVSFEESVDDFPRGFPVRAGMWSGDEAALVRLDPLQAREAEPALKFVAPKLDLPSSASVPKSCDVYHIVDLRDWKNRFRGADCSVELSARYVDLRDRQGATMDFVAQIYLFQGDPELAHTGWPYSIGSALATSKEGLKSSGGEREETIRTACLVPSEVDYAVIHLAVAPTQPPASFDSLFVHDVHLKINKVRYASRASPRG